MQRVMPTAPPEEDMVGVVDGVVVAIRDLAIGVKASCFLDEIVARWIGSEIWSRKIRVDRLDQRKRGDQA